MILGLEIHTEKLRKDYQENILPNNKISNRTKCIILRALFEQYCYQVLIVTNLINISDKDNNSLEHQQYKTNHSGWNHGEFRIWVNKKLEKDFKWLWRISSNPGVMGVIFQGLLGNERKHLDEIIEFHKEYYKKFLINSHHRKIFEISDKDFETVSNKINNLFQNILSLKWTNDNVKIIITNGGGRYKHIMQNNSIVCAAAPPTNPKYNKPIEAYTVSIKTLLIYITRTKNSKNIMIQGPLKNIYICTFCIKRMLGIIDYDDFIGWDKIQEAIRQNKHIMDYIQNG